MRRLRFLYVTNALLAIKCLHIHSYSAYVAKIACFARRLAEKANEQRSLVFLTKIRQKRLPTQGASSCALFVME